MSCGTKKVLLHVIIGITIMQTWDRSTKETLMIGQSVVREFQNVLGKDKVFLDETDRHTYSYDAAVLEPVLPSVLLYLVDATDTVVDLTLTAGDGSYLFTVPSIAAYKVQVSVPDGWVLTTPDQGGDDTLDSDADPNMGIFLHHRPE